MNPSRELFPILLFLAALILFGMSGTAGAFHSGGVAPCDGCHSMHQSQSNPIQGLGNNILTKGTDASSTCLNCHAGQGSPASESIFSPDCSAMTPGGDFCWLGKSFTWVDGSSPGDSHGHNIIAQDYNLTADTRHTLAPGGSYLANDLGCNSCHDPHGKSRAGLPVKGSGSYGAIPEPGITLGSYRLLGGSDYDGGGHVPGYVFFNDPPVASQNSAVPYGETDMSHADYGSGMSEWCANCHAGILLNSHKGGLNAFEHPVGNGAGLEDFIAAYNSYVSTGDLSGSVATSYLALVPFERGVTDTALLNPNSTLGPDSSSNIMCLTCHRAHASAFPYMGRWDFTSPLMINSHPAMGDVGVTGNEVFYSYYGRDMATEFGVGQRILCEKCHDVPRDGYPPGW
jgi:hypothetical protein